MELIDKGAMAVRFVAKFVTTRGLSVGPCKTKKDGERFLVVIKKSILTDAENLLNDLKRKTKQGSRLG